MTQYDDRGNEVENPLTPFLIIAFFAAVIWAVRRYIGQAK